MGRVLYPSILPQDLVDSLVEDMLREVNTDYYAAAKLACVKYIVMDPEEAIRLGLQGLELGEDRTYV